MTRTPSAFRLASAVARALLTLACASGTALGQKAHTFDLVLGSVYGGGGEYRDRLGFVLGAQFDYVSEPNKPLSRGLGLRFDVLATSPGSGDDCLLAPAGGCVPRYPSFVAVGLGPFLSLHGPALVRVDVGGGAGSYFDVDDFSPNLGLFGQLRAIVPRDAPLSLGVGLTLHSIPNAGPASLWMRSFSVTIRIAGD